MMLGAGSSGMPNALRFAVSSLSMARIDSHFSRSFSAFSRASADWVRHDWTWASYSTFQESSDGAGEVVSSRTSSR